MKFSVFRNFDKEKGEIYFTFDSQKFFSEIELDRIHFAPILKNEKLKLFVNFLEPVRFELLYHLLTLFHLL